MHPCTPIRFRPGCARKRPLPGSPSTGTGVTIAAPQRIDRYWRPYHAEIERRLANIKARHGFALLWDAHSIASSVPRLFDGQLPQLNIGTNTGASCPPEVQAAVSQVAERSAYSLAINERFRGGYITRHFGSIPTDQTVTLSNSRSLSAVTWTNSRCVMMPSAPRDATRHPRSDVGRLHRFGSSNVRRCQVKKTAGLHKLYADDPRAADRLVWGREAHPVSRRGFLRGTGLVAMSRRLGQRDSVRGAFARRD